ncbi:hypothetical protein ACQPYK_49220 (plasmid) [Streptosporangium sp. CA-135522]|uniref:hypothetical protein n=1 Tax=Streptosporangium sp. CA-135522 TaxID=3240072 RepID=UPI003D910875
MLHLGSGTVCVHAVAMHRPEVGAALLLGGHGAGKTLVGVALALRGWHWLAGDVTLLDVAAEGGAAVRGGTTAILGRRSAIRRWFPELTLPEGPDTVDLHGQGGLPSSLATITPVRVPVAAAVLVDVDGDPLATGRTLQPVDRHTAATVWLRASGHLLDRILDDGEQPLRLLEDGPAQRQRLHYVHALARSVGMHAARGTPQGIAARIEQLITDRRQGDRHDQADESNGAGAGFRRHPGSAGPQPGRRHGDRGAARPARREHP